MVDEPSTYMIQHQPSSTVVAPGEAPRLRMAGGRSLPHHLLGGELHGSHGKPGRSDLAAVTMAVGSPGVGSLGAGGEAGMMALIGLGMTW